MLTYGITATSTIKEQRHRRKRSFTAIYDWQNNSVVQLGNQWTNPVYVTADGDGEHFYATSDSGMRQALQWQGFTVFHVDPNTGKASEIKSNFKGNVFPSYSGQIFNDV